MSEKATYIIDLSDAFSPKLKAASTNLDGFENKLGRVAGKNGSGGMLGTFATAASRAFAPLAIAAGLTMFTGKVISLGAEMEQTKVAMEVMVGDAEKANKLFGQMNNFANATPFANKDIIDTGKLLLSFGTAVEDVMPTVAMLGDIAGGNAEKLHSLGLAFAQMSSTGRLMGQDLLQMVNAGFNPLKIISEKTGKSMGFLKEQMEKGRIGADMVKAAFTAATSEGGLFFGMMDKQSKTMAGMWSTFTGTLEHSMATFGMKLGPTIVKVIKFMNDGLEMLTRVDFSPFMATFNQIFEMFGELGEAFMDLFQALGFAQDGMSLMQTIFDAFAVSLRIGQTPLRLLIFGLTTVVNVVDNIWEGMKGLGNMILGVVKIAMTLVDVFRDLGTMMEGVFTGNFDMIKTGFENAVKTANEGGEAALKMMSDGWDQTKNAAKEGFNEAMINGFNAWSKEKEGWKKAFDGGTADEVKKTDAIDRFKFDPSALTNFGEGKGKKDKTSKVDGEVRSGGVKNIVINIQQLVGSVSFESMNKMSENQMVEIVKRALLTAVNDANTAVQ